MMKLIKINYPQKFRDEWITIPKYGKWLRRVDGNERNCCCTCCNVILTTKLSSIEKHANTLKHKAAEVLIPDDIEIPIVVKSESAKKKRKMKPEGSKKLLKIEEGAILEEELQTNNNQILEEFCSPEDTPTSTLKFIKTSKYKKERNGNEAPQKIIYASSSSNQVSGTTYVKKKSEHELDSFGRSIIAQMKMLPEEHAIELTLEIQNLVTQRRLKVISEKLSERQHHQQQTHHTNQVPQVITVSVGGPSYTTIQPEPFNPLEIMNPKEPENHGFGTYYVSPR